MLTKEQMTELREIATDEVAEASARGTGQDKLSLYVDGWATEIVARQLNPDGVLDSELVGDLEAEVGAAIYGAYSWEYARVLARESVLTARK